MKSFNDFQIESRIKNIKETLKDINEGKLSSSIVSKLKKQYGKLKKSKLGNLAKQEIVNMWNDLSDEQKQQLKDAGINFAMTAALGAKSKLFKK
jgi:molybdopterin converting factor small subunit